MDLTRGLLGGLGIEVESASGDEVRLRMTADERHHQPDGIVHGGVHCALVETAASIGAGLWFGERDAGGRVVGVHNATDFLRAVRTGELRATASPVHRGRSQQLWDVAVRDADERLVARGSVRLQNLGADPA